MTPICITELQKKSSDFIAACDKFYINSSVLEQLLYKWYNMPENEKSHQKGELPFPSDAWLSEQIFPESIIFESKEAFDKAMEIYKNYFSEGIEVYIDYDSAIHFSNNINQLLGEKATKVLPAKEDGKYIVLLSKPQYKNNINQYETKTQDKHWARTSENSYEVSTDGDSRFSALKAKFKEGTIIEGEDVSGKTIEWVYQNVIKKSGKGKAPAENSKLYRRISNTFTLEDFIVDVPDHRDISGGTIGINNKGNYISFKTIEGAFQAAKLSYLDDVEYTKEEYEKLVKEGADSDTIKKKLSEATTPKEAIDIANKYELDKQLSKKWYEASDIIRKALENKYGYDDISKDVKEDFSYEVGYLPLWQEWAKQNPELIEELREKSAGKVLTDKFANTRVSQARALADILNNTEYTSTTTIEEEENYFEKEDTNTEPVSEEESSSVINNKFIENQTTKYDKISTVYGINSIITGEEFRQIAKDIAYAISDIITEVQKNPEAAKKYNKSINIDNIEGASRKDILAQLGPATVIKYIRDHHFSPLGNKNITGRKQAAKGNLVATNIEAFLIQASTMLSEIERFGIDSNMVITETIDSNTEVDLNNETDIEAIQEVEGNLQEHWQKESRTENAYDKASVLVRQALTQCYKTNPDGSIVESEWSIKQRMEGRDALSYMIKWTQGSFTISSMVKKLEAKAEKNKWVQPIIDRLKDKSGKESTFQSQFFSIVNKHSQLYSIGKKENGRYFVFEANRHPALLDAKNSIKGLYNAGAHPLFDSSGNINMSNYEKLEDLYTELSNMKYSEETAQEISEKLEDASKILGYPISAQAILEILDGNTFKEMTTKSLQYVVTSIKENRNNKTWEPFSGDPEKNGIINNIGKFISPITNKLDDVINTSFYDNGKMYQSNVTPSYLTKLIQKFSLFTEEEFDAFLEDEYGKYKQFYDDKIGWRNSWLELMAFNPHYRSVMTHKVQLNFNKNRYMANKNGSRAMIDSEVLISMVAEYFKEASFTTNTPLAESWFRIPLMSNKQSSEFIKFYSYRGGDYKKQVLNGCMKLFGQELSRIQVVKERDKLYDKDAPERIANFDGERGKQFCFFDFLNNSKDERFNELVEIITDGNYDKNKEKALKIELAKKARELIENEINERFEGAFNQWSKNGAVEEVTKLKGINKSNVREALENFYWNDFLAANNILNLTITDPAYYKNTKDIQKRLAQLHSPGIRGNIEATDFNGNRVTDSKLRTIYFKDAKIKIDNDRLKSNIIDNIRVIFNNKLKSLDKNAPNYIATKEFYDAIIDSFEKGINITDAQGYASPTSYRKKALMFGKWDAHSEKIYQKLISGEYTYTDLQVAFQPRKPFVYTQISKDSGLPESNFPTLKMGVQNKNSEYLLFLAGAIMQGENTGLPNYLEAIYTMMENSHKGETDVNGNHIPRVDGIDTVQFESAVKDGLTGKIDIITATTTEEAIKLLEDLIYTDKENHIYNPAYVQEINGEDYSDQQEIPEHFKDHEQQYGSQIRMIIPSDLNPNKTYKIDGVERDAKEFRKVYEEIIAENIQESIDDLRQEFGLYLESEEVQKNIPIAKLLQKEIDESPRYGIDLAIACLLDEYGKFRVPLGDPIHAKRIEQMLNSIVKNRINKQKISGGPVVQVSNFGTSRRLEIKFKGKNGEILDSLNDYLKADKSRTEEDWKNYIEKNQSGVAYYEAYVPAYTQSIFEDFMDSEGNIDIDAIEKIDPDLLKLIGYRIPTEDKYSTAPIKIVGFMPKEAGDGIMLPYEITLITGSDFDIDKFFIMRKDIPIKTNSRKEIKSKLIDIFGKKSIDDINIFLDQISNNDQKTIAKDNYPEIFKEYVKIAYKTDPYTKGFKYRNNKLIDMTWEVLTHEDTADKLLNPGGFEEQKKEGYLMEAIRVTGKSLTELEHLSIEELQKEIENNLTKTENLAFIDTHLQYYKQNSAAGSLLSIFAVSKSAHACLESNGFKIDVSETCKIEKPYSIMGLELFGKIEIDPQKDIEGNFIGKTLGSLVASAADAVKDPVLNYMNINSETVNILNTLIRLGLPFRKASRLLSTKVVSRLLNEYNSQRLSKKTSFNRVLKETIESYKKDIGDTSVLDYEDITDEEINESIRNTDFKTDYKILLALQRVLQINNGLKSLNFATRFNSMSSTVGPLVIDNLKIENQLDHFEGYIYNENFEEAGFEDVFEAHPILAKFAESVQVARELFGKHSPLYSNQFKEILNNLYGTDMLNKIFSDRKVFSKFADFYLSYLITANDVVVSNTNKINYYIKKFPSDFAKKDYKTIYAGNPFIDAIRLGVNSNSENPTLEIKLSGIDNEVKSRLTSGWLDLYKSGEEGKKLALQLFEYNFFRGGIGFNPKTFMSLLPVQIRMELENYKKTFEKLPDINTEILVYSFLRNFAYDDSVVPHRDNIKGIKIYDNGVAKIYGEKAKKYKNSLAFTTVINNNMVLLVQDFMQGYNEEKESVTFRICKPLGNDGEFIEIYPVVVSNGITSNRNTSKEAKPTTNFEEESMLNNSTEDVIEPEVLEEDEEADSLIKSGYTEEQINKMATNLYSRIGRNALAKIKEEAKASSKSINEYYDRIKAALYKVAEEKGIKVTQEQVEALASKFC